MSSRADTLFLEVLQLPEAERVAFLDEACKGDAELRRQIEARIADDTAAEAFFDGPPTVAASSGLTSPGGEAPGEMIGRYKLLERIGEGGFGEAEEPSYFYDLLLEAGKQGYSKPVPISQSLRPGEADHFVVRIASNKSARFDLDLSLKDASGRVLPLQTVHLDLFVPRSQAGYAAARR